MEDFRETLKTALGAGYVVKMFYRIDPTSSFTHHRYLIEKDGNIIAYKNAEQKELINGYSNWSSFELFLHGRTVELLQIDHQEIWPKKLE